MPKANSREINKELGLLWAKLTKTDLPGDPWHPERIYHFWSVHLKTLPRPAFVFDTSPTADRKREAIACYASQFPNSAARPTVPERVAAADAWWGSMIGTTAGEPFACREPIGLTGFGNLR